LEYYSDITTSKWDNELRLGKDVAALYEGGSIAVPAGRPAMTYVLARHHEIPADKFQSQMYDPFAYSTSPDPFAAWPEFRVNILDWLKKLDIRMIVFQEANSTYKKMTDLEAEWFQYLGSSGGMLIYGVQLPLARTDMGHLAINAR
jgi:hypothetical protein